MLLLTHQCRLVHIGVKSDFSFSEDNFPGVKGALIRGLGDEAPSSGRFNPGNSPTKSLFVFQEKR